MFMVGVLAGSGLFAWGVGWGQPVAFVGGVVLLILSVLNSLHVVADHVVGVAVPLAAGIALLVPLAGRPERAVEAPVAGVQVTATAAARTPAPAAAATGGQDPVALGRQLASAKGCAACHTATGARSTGPTWKGLFGKRETLQDGSQVTVDEAYIRESILNPNANVVRGFQPIMPQLPVTEQELEALIAYIKSLQ